MARIRICGKGDYVAMDGETILEAGLRAGFGFPKACRNGNCGRCAGQLLDGTVTLKGRTTPLRASRPEGCDILFCIAHPDSDCDIGGIEITAPGEWLVNTLHCQIADIRPLNHNISAVTLRLPAGQRVLWHAGQYLLLGEQQDSAFSIANACVDGQRELSLHIRHDADNDSAVALMAQLQASATVVATLPLGERYIAAIPDRPVWFICGSTGFAPARAMIERLSSLRFALPVRLFRGGRRPEDIYPAQWRPDTLGGLIDFHQVESVNDDPRPGQIKGLVHEAALAMLNEPTLPLFHIGGSPAMAWAVFDALLAAGVPAQHIHSDVFDYAPRGADL
ncbi:MAG: 2Fe-2S iron-sulfur cluster-binding protein [Alcanivoracaceae bacterium]